MFLVCTGVSVKMPSVELFVPCDLEFLESALSLRITCKSGVSNNNTPAVGFPSEKQLSV